MTSAWGLLNQVHGNARFPSEADEWPRLSATLAAGFVDIPVVPRSAGTITWRGSLIVTRRGRYRLAFASDRRPVVTLDGETLSTPALVRARVAGVELAPGLHPVVVELSTSPPPKFIRWMWIPPASDGSRRDGVPWAIVPPSALRPARAVEVIGDASG